MEAVRLERAFVRVAGPEAEAYLQGQLSNDIGQSPVGLTFLLEPTGKVTALLRWQRHATDELLLDTDAEAGDAVLARLRRFLLRTKATVDPEEHRLLRLFGGPPADVPTLPAVWPPDDDDAPVDLLDVDAPPGTHDLDPFDYERRRILAGVPVSGVDVGPDTIPAEVGRWAIDAAVSFTKGCYTGQELVARIDSRGGNVPRPLRVLQSPDGVPLPPGADVFDDGDVVGHVTSAAADVALAPIARRVEVGATVRLGDGTPAVVLR